MTDKTLKVSKAEAVYLYRALAALRPRSSADRVIDGPLFQKLQALVSVKDRPDQRVLDGDYVLTRLRDAADDYQHETLDELTRKADIIWRCSDEECSWDNPEADAECSQCGLARGAEPPEDSDD